MYSGIRFGQEGTPLTILSKEEYDQWQSQQSEFTQAWLSNSHYKKSGLALIPDQQGSLSSAIFVADNPTALFACADLAKALPAQSFLLEATPAVQKKCAIAFGLGQYSFNKYKASTEKKAELIINDQALVDEALKYIEATYLVRDMINTPAGDMMPEHMSQVVQDTAKQFGASFSEIVGSALLEHNYPTIHAVGRASVHEPRLLDFTWGDPKHPKITLVGKGVCFDSGGLDLKPSAAMRNMKKDMGGAAHVMGVAHLIMSHKLPVRLRVLIPSVENAVSSNAFRPGDVITTRQGLTVEIDNTDAEGRLVLCDALTEANSENPELILDFATLTGACRVALGTELPGFFSTDSKLALALQESGESNDDPVWRLPLHQAYRDMLKSDVADMTNCVSSPFGGAITAALYLQSFVEGDTPWIHFDVMAWNNRSLPGRPVGGEAMGVRAVFDFIRQQYC